MSLRRRLVLITVAVVAIALIAADIGAYVALRSMLVSRVEQDLLSSAKASTKMVMDPGLVGASRTVCSRAVARIPRTSPSIAKGALDRPGARRSAMTSGRCRIRSFPTSPPIPRLVRRWRRLDAADRREHHRPVELRRLRLPRRRASRHLPAGSWSWRCRSTRPRRPSDSWPSSRRPSPCIVLLLVALLATWTVGVGLRPLGAHRGHGSRDRGRRPRAADRVGRSVDRGRSARARAQHDARPDRGGADRPRGVRAAAQASRHRRVARAAHPVDGDSRLRGAVPSRGGPASGRPRASDARDRVRIRADGGAGRRAAPPCPTRRGAGAAVDGGGPRPGRSCRGRRRPGHRTRPTARCAPSRDGHGPRGRDEDAPGRRQPADQRPRPHASRHSGHRDRSSRRQHGRPGSRRRRARA